MLSAERIYAELFAAPSRRRWRSGAGARAIENALLDTKAKLLACPATNCSAAKFRDRIASTVALRHLAHQSPAWYKCDHDLDA